MSRIIRNGRFRRSALLTGLILCVAAGLSSYKATAHRVFALNYSESLPHWAFIIDRGREPHVGDMVFFVPPENRFYGDRPFVKKIAAGPGDRVSIIDHQLFINGEPLCELLEQAKDGSPLHPGPTGIIPDGQYFIHSNHERSYDSRYRDIGWISAGRIIGVVTDTIL
tara:strand:+ start:2269 stop:2769 length:501 start_codon:yes stop_codon:yes gene_type:complete